MSLTHISQLDTSLVELKLDMPTGGVISSGVDSTMIDKTSDVAHSQSLDGVVVRLSDTKSLVTDPPLAGRGYITTAELVIDDQSRREVVPTLTTPSIRFCAANFERSDMDKAFVSRILSEVPATSSVSSAAALVDVAPLVVDPSLVNATPSTGATPLAEAATSPLMEVVTPLVETQSSPDTKFWVDNKSLGPKCRICGLLYFIPVSTRCGHTYCQSCIVRCMTTSAECPECHRIIKHGDLKSADSVYHDTLGMIFGCVESPRCRWEGTFREREFHVLNECKWSVRHCPFDSSRCDAVFGRGLHTTAEATHETECQFAPVRCPFHSVGCVAGENGWMFRSQIESHLQQSLLRHLCLVNGAREAIDNSSGGSYGVVQLLFQRWSTTPYGITRHSNPVYFDGANYRLGVRRDGISTLGIYLDRDRQGVITVKFAAEHTNGSESVLLCSESKQKYGPNGGCWGSGVVSVPLECYNQAKDCLKFFAVIKRAPASFDNLFR
jgi:hypothetical protein